MTDFSYLESLPLSERVDEIKDRKGRMVAGGAFVKE